MRGAFLRVMWLALAFFLASLLFPAAAQAEPDGIHGLELFERKWQSNDVLCPHGDGLGPKRNASSCAACHRQGGIGGAGPNENNVVLLASASGSSNVLHHYGTEDDYAKERARFVQHASFQSINALVDPPRHVTRTPRKTLPPQVVKLPRSIGHGQLAVQRNTPALFGAGMIDAIPDEELERLAEKQPLAAPGITGRVARTAGGVGKFGWRGQTNTLLKFVQGACENELGLSIDRFGGPMNPANGNNNPPKFDLSASQCQDLAEFVRLLSRPRQVLPTNDGDRQLVQFGEKLFESIGCAACHVSNLANVDGLYSDLLLHDMGEGLADPSPAPPPLPQPLTAMASFVSSAYGVSFPSTPGPVLEETQREWRTPPLWGVRDSAPYLHDGRATTLDEAIRLHGGEARESVSAFRQLSKSDQKYLLAFLNSLAAP